MLVLDVRSSLQIFYFSKSRSVKHINIPIKVKGLHSKSNKGKITDANSHKVLKIKAPILQGKKCPCGRRYIC